MNHELLQQLRAERDALDVRLAAGQELEHTLRQYLRRLESANGRRASAIGHVDRTISLLVSVHHAEAAAAAEQSAISFPSASRPANPSGPPVSQGGPSTIPLPGVTSSAAPRPRPSRPAALPQPRKESTS